MTKAQAIHSFWNSFGIPAYEATTVNDEQTGDFYIYLMHSFKSRRYRSISDICTLREDSRLLSEYQVKTIQSEEFIST